jgi:hypothetical protein
MREEKMRDELIRFLLERLEVDVDEIEEEFALEARLDGHGRAQLADYLDNLLGGTYEDSLPGH